MKKILSLIAVLIMGIASISIVTSQHPCIFGDGTNPPPPPSECQQCVIDFCENNCLEPPCMYCSISAFFMCQERWFTPYWMEVYSNELKGCYSRDLLCFNAPIEPKCPEICRGICYSNLDDGTQECIDECCQRADCYLYGELEEISYPYARAENGGAMILTIPSCTDSRIFFKDPPPCGVLNGGTNHFVAEINNLHETYPPCCIDLRGCGSAPSPECATQCNGYNMPPNYRCDVNEYVIMEIRDGEGQVFINGMSCDFSCWGEPLSNEETCCPETIVWYNGKKPFDSPDSEVVIIQGVPRTIAIDGPGSIQFTLEQKCCYDCKEKPQLPSSILYPKVDIETLSVAGGPTVIQDGKVIASLTTSPGTQQAMIQVENRGFFTQNDSRVRFEGLPQGVTVSVLPDSQKITAHNIGTYSATFTVGPNVPSGTYEVTIYAYSPQGVFDTIKINLIIP